MWSMAEGAGRLFRRLSGPYVSRAEGPTNILPWLIHRKLARYVGEEKWRMVTMTSCIEW